MTRMTYTAARALLSALDIGSTLRVSDGSYSAVFRSSDGYDVGPFEGLDLGVAAETLSGMDAPDPDAEGTAF